MSIRGAGDRWLAGEPVDHVAFAPNEAVTVAAGPRAGSAGRVVLLLGLRPEPSYLVELADGSDVRARQSELRPPA